MPQSSQSKLGTVPYAVVGIGALALTLGIVAVVNPMVGPSPNRLTSQVAATMGMPPGVCNPLYQNCPPGMPTVAQPTANYFPAGMPQQPEMYPPDAQQMYGAAPGGGLPVGGGEVSALEHQLMAQGQQVAELQQKMQELHQVVQQMAQLLSAQQLQFQQQLASTEAMRAAADEPGFLGKLWRWIW